MTQEQITEHLRALAAEFEQIAANRLFERADVVRETRKLIERTARQMGAETTEGRDERPSKDDRSPESDKD